MAMHMSSSSRGLMTWVVTRMRCFVKLQMACLDSNSSMHNNGEFLVKWNGALQA